MPQGDVDSIVDKGAIAGCGSGGKGRYSDACLDGGLLALFWNHPGIQCIFLGC